MKPQNLIITIIHLYEHRKVYLEYFLLISSNYAIMLIFFFTIYKYSKKDNETQELAKIIQNGVLTGSDFNIKLV